MANEKLYANRAGREEADFYYFTKLIYQIGADENWSIMREENPYSRCDCWLVNNKSKLFTPVEIKGRDVNLEDIRTKGVLIDKQKTDSLLAFCGRAVVVQFFPSSNRALVWVINKDDDFQVQQMPCRKNNVENEKVLKKVVMLDVRKAKEYELDLHSYYNIVAFSSILYEDETII